MDVYILLDDLRFDVYFASYKSSFKKYERVIVKVFQKNNERIVIETIEGKDNIIYDNRVDTNSDLLDYDLTLLKVMERFVSDREIPGMIYEKLPGIGSWCRIKQDDTNKKLIEELGKKEKLKNLEEMKEVFLKIFDI